MLLNKQAQQLQNKDKRDMLEFRIRSTPNPNARKYILSEEVKATGKVTYRSQDECEHIPLAQGLFSIPAVKQIHLFENVITITQDASREWANIDQDIQNVCLKYVGNHDIFFNEQTKNSKPAKELTGDLLIIDNILGEFIRPSLQADGGDIEVLEYEDNILSVRYMGACGDCPSSYTGTLNAIESVLSSNFNDKIQVAVVK
jgi:NFU1 iron-sulfur cluster scaffold homolog, mitochondrial